MTPTKYIQIGGGRLLKSDGEPYLNGARPVLPQYADIFQSYFSENFKSSWFNFVPFVISYHLPPRRRLEFIEESSALFIYQISNYGSNDSQSRVDLFAPPCPLNKASLDCALDTAKSNSQSQIRILWTDANDLELLERLYGPKLELTVKDEEYIYSPRLVFELKGSKYKDLRKKINRLERLEPVFRELETSDLPSAMKLLKDWRRTQGRKRDFLLDWGYTRSALDRQFYMNKSDITSWCVEIDGELEGFAMAGPISEDTACIFIVKTNVDIGGLSEYLRWKVCERFQEFKYLNDAGDLNLPGLRQHKMKMRPVGFNKVSSVKLFL